MRVSPADVEKIAALARLSISSQEAGTYGSQLSNILDYIEKLNALNTSDIEPTYNAVGLENVARQDSISTCLTQEEALSNAPDQSDGFYRVPRIIE
jgi:aspartyl-tRNA(Asn)/glutamyl-tRNA(Gln) amidotransferase subunit C